MILLIEPKTSAALLIITAGVPHSRTICVLWCILRLLWPTKSYPKSPNMCLSFDFPTDMKYIFQMMYHMTLYVHFQQNCRPSKLAVEKKLRCFGFKATFFATLYSKSLLFRRHGFDSRRGQTLGAHSLAALWQKWMFFATVKDPIDTCL